MHAVPCCATACKAVHPCQRQFKRQASSHLFHLVPFSSAICSFSSHFCLILQSLPFLPIFSYLFTQFPSLPLLLSSSLCSLSSRSSPLYATPFRFRFGVAVSLSWSLTAPWCTGAPTGIVFCSPLRGWVYAVTSLWEVFSSVLRCPLDMLKPAGLTGCLNRLCPCPIARPPYPCTRGSRHAGMPFSYSLGLLHASRLNGGTMAGNKLCCRSQTGIGHH